MKRFAIVAVMGFSLLLSLLPGCKSGKVQKLQADDRTKGLKDFYKDYFTMGVAVSPQGLKRPEESQLIIQ